MDVRAVIVAIVLAVAGAVWATWPVQAAMPLYRVYSAGSHGCVAVLFAGSNPIGIAAWSTPSVYGACGSGQ